jgi:hypothetical protein
MELPVEVLGRRGRGRGGRREEKGGRRESRER